MTAALQNIQYKLNEALNIIKKPEIFKEIQEKFLEKNITITNYNDFILICEDSGLCIKKLNNFPGALIKFYYDCLDNKKIIKYNKNLKAKTICCIGILINEKVDILNINNGF